MLARRQPQVTGGCYISQHRQLTSFRRARTKMITASKAWDQVVYAARTPLDTDRQNRAECLAAFLVLDVAASRPPGR